jgi:4-hydroxy-4-methyl-2-oxoglutarate aldolase
VTHVDGNEHSTATLYEAAQALLRTLHTPGTELSSPRALDPDIGAAWPGARVSGPAFTVQGAGGDNLALHHAVLTAPAGHVLVVDAGGAPFGHWGEVLAVAAQQRDIAGLVIDGGVRDVDALATLGFPVFARHTSIRGTRKLFRGALGTSVEVGGVTVHTGDLVVGDADGVIVLPRAHAAAVLVEADRRVADEQRIVEALRSGATTLQIYGLGERV